MVRSGRAGHLSRCPESPVRRRRDVLGCCTTSGNRLPAVAGFDHVRQFVHRDPPALFVLLRRQAGRQSLMKPRDDRRIYIFPQAVGNRHHALHRRVSRLELDLLHDLAAWYQPHEAPVKGVGRSGGLPACAVVVVRQRDPERASLSRVKIVHDAGHAFRDHPSLYVVPTCQRLENCSRWPLQSDVPRRLTFPEGSAAICPLPAAGRRPRLGKGGCPASRRT